MLDRSIKWFLLASMLVNAALIGFISAQFFRGVPPMMAMRHMPPPPNSGWPDETTRAALDKAFDGERAALDSALKEMMASRSKSVDLMRANTLDTAALNAELTTTRDANIKAMAAFQRAITTAAATLKPEQRASLAQMLDRAPPGRMGPMGALGPPIVMPLGGDFGMESQDRLKSNGP